MTATRQPNYQTKTNKAALLVAFVVTCLFALPSLPCPYDWDYDYVNYVLLIEPTSYPLRCGQREPASDDMVSMPSGYDERRPWHKISPGCYKVDTEGFIVAYSFKVNFAAFVSVTVEDSEGKVLYQKTTSFPTPPAGLIHLDGFRLPKHIDELRVKVQWAQWEPAVIFPIFVVLDAPKAPMDPDWVSLLRYSCRWGRGTNNPDDAAQAITFGVFFQRPGFAYPQDGASHWLVGTTFMLKALLDEWNAGRWTDGNCVDVSCLTMLALCSVGLDFSVRQLTGTKFSDLNGGLPVFRTNPICPIGSDPTLDGTYSPWDWIFHQVCVITGAPDPPSNEAGIWDPTAAQKEDLNGNGYRNPPAHHPTHLWPQKDYWQKPHPQVPGGWLGLVGQPIQGPSDPRTHGLGTWKCGVSADPYQPPP